MSRIFGAMRQVGHVVPDVHKAIEQWLRQGVGPWYVVGERIPVDVVYEGATSAAEITVAMANSGPVQIELIHQDNDVPSLWRAFLDSGRSGVQHWSSWADDYEATFGRAEEAGFLVAQEGNGFVYFHDETDPLMAIEVAELTPERAHMFEVVRGAARGWDGSDPVRSFE